MRVLPRSVGSGLIEVNWQGQMHLCTPQEESRSPGMLNPEIGISIQGDEVGGLYPLIGWWSQLGARWRGAPFPGLCPEERVAPKRLIYSPRQRGYGRETILGRGRYRNGAVCII